VVKIIFASSSSSSFEENFGFWLSNFETEAAEGSVGFHRYDRS